MKNDLDTQAAQELLEAIQFFNSKGWSPATSTNYSVRSQKEDEIIISRSGVDKSKFRLEDLIFIDRKGIVLDPPGVKSSAETEIHTHIYDRFPAARCVLHTHSVLGTSLSMIHAKEGMIRFAGYEILKGLEGNATHELEEILPIVPNSQHMPDILKNMATHFDKNIHGFLIEGHGLYTWGPSVAVAKRHIETYEFLFECLDKTRTYYWPS